MKLSQILELYLRSRVTLINIVSREEERIVVKNFDLASVCVADQVADHLRVIRPAVHHGQQNPFNL